MEGKVKQQQAVTKSSTLAFLKVFVLDFKLTTAAKHGEKVSLAAFISV